MTGSVQRGNNWFATYSIILMTASFVQVSSLEDCEDYAFTDGNITVGNCSNASLNLQSFAHLQSLRVSGISLKSLSLGNESDMVNIEELDVNSKLQIIEVPYPLFLQADNLSKINFHDSKMKCAGINETNGKILERMEQVQGTETVFCIDFMRTLDDLIDKYKHILESCPKRCHCYIKPPDLKRLSRNRKGRKSSSFSRTSRQQKKTPITPITVQVDCSNKSLKAFPAVLPERTHNIDLSHNQIQDFSTFNESVYKGASIISLNYNALEKLTAKDMMKLLSLPQRFTTRVYLHSNFLSELNFDGLHKIKHDKLRVYVFLTENSWVCDCERGTKLKEALTTFTKEGQTKLAIIDRDDVICGKRSGMLHTYKVRELTSSDFCPIYLECDIYDVINMFLSFLIVLLFGKMGFDYWYFKKVGRLPYISELICYCKIPAR